VKQEHTLAAFEDWDKVVDFELDSVVDDKATDEDQFLLYLEYRNVSYEDIENKHPILVC
jgi:hypothetical protein